MTFSLVDVPNLRFVSPRQSAAKPLRCSIKSRIRLSAAEHDKLPRVVKFSGGRSSGMMLFILLQNGLLKASRGDVVVFNNTSAEHPATYDFAARCKKICEQEYNIPFLWTEFQTYEDSVRGVWMRQSSYRLVSPKPISEKNPDGYRGAGEVFEELLSWRKYLPNKFQRTCTEKMKIEVTREFLRDWFAVKPGIERQGHYYDKSAMTDEDVITLHRQNRGKTPDDILLEKAAFVRSCPHFRPAQNFADFSEAVAEIKNPHLQGKNLGGRVDLSGDNCVDYIAFVGFRDDEPARVARMKARNYKDDDCEAEEKGPEMQPEGEYVYAPLAEMNISKDDVMAFWKKQKWDLRLPHDVNFSNCVYCFLKGAATLTNIQAQSEKVEKKLPQKLRVKDNTPGDINWWVEIERKYSRDLKREKRKIKNAETAGDAPMVGFWGNNGRLSYQKIAEAQRSQKKTIAIVVDNPELPCDCTD